MFLSACSLRSTQCAALIALAAAAGISRFEHEPAASMTNDSGAAPPQSTTARAIFSDQRSLTFASVRWFQSAAETLIAIFAPERARAATQNNVSANSPVDSPAPSPFLAGDSSLAPPPPAIGGTVIFFPEPAPAVTEHDHVWPYAVGPPRHGTNRQKILRVASTAVPCDSTPRRMSASTVSRIAFSPFEFVARDSRALSVGPVSAAPHVSPGFVLRDEPEFSSAVFPAAPIVLARPASVSRHRGPANLFP
jgi:hypothetical protein